MHATITSKGQVTLPKALRDRLHLASGDRIEFVMEADDNVRLVVRRGSVERLKGFLPKPDRPVSTEEMEHAIEREAGKS